MTSGAEVLSLRAKMRAAQLYDGIKHLYPEFKDVDRDLWLSLLVQSWIDGRGDGLDACARLVKEATP